MKSIDVCIGFDGRTEEAMNFYASVFPNAKLGLACRVGPAMAKLIGRAENSVLTRMIRIGDTEIMGLDMGPEGPLTQALSFFVHCESEAQTNLLWEKLLDGGRPAMALDQYPWADRYGWVVDRFGVSWQLIFAKSVSAFEVRPAFLFVDELYGKGNEALEFYQKIFPSSGEESVSRDAKTRVVQHAMFHLGQSKFVLMEGAGEHNFKFTQSFSLTVNCDSQDEIDHVWRELTANGGREIQCGWLEDRFGVSWQVVPWEMAQWMSDPKRADALMAAFVRMKKFDRATLAQIAEK